MIIHRGDVATGDTTPADAVKNGGGVTTGAQGSAGLLTPRVKGEI